MHGCRVRSRGYRRRVLFPHGPFDYRVRRTVGGMVAACVLAAFIIQGCRGQLEPTSKKSSSPSSGMGCRYVSASCPFFQPASRNYLSASAGHAGISSRSHDAGSLEGSTDPGKAAQPRAVSSTRADELLIEALISAAIDGEGCKAAPGVADGTSGFYFTKMVVTAYCPLKCCCDRYADNFTASGHKIKLGQGEKFAAAPKQYPFGTIFDIPGYGVAECRDRGGAIRGNKLDLYFDTHTAAKVWGIKTLIVKVQAATSAVQCSAHGGALGFN